MANTMTLGAKEYESALVSWVVDVHFSEDANHKPHMANCILISRRMLEDGDVQVGLIVNGQAHEPPIPIFVESMEKVADSVESGLTSDE